MKRNGFTLIELLAVIVILAIIALIAVPIVLGIIDNSKKESQEGSIELYASAVKNAVAKHQINNPSDNVEGEFTSNDKGTELTGNVDLSVEYDGNVKCDTIEVYSNGTVYLADCKVDGNSVEYTYGKKQESTSGQVFKPDFYTWDLSGTVNSTSAPAEPSATPPEGKNFYLGYNVNESTGVVSEAFVCFKRTSEGKEYCLKGYDTTAYSDNQDVIRDAFSEIADTACNFGDIDSYCRTGGLNVDANSSGLVYADDGSAGCNVADNGYFVCSEW